MILVQKDGELTFFGGKRSISLLEKNGYCRFTLGTGEKPLRIHGLLKFPRPPNYLFGNKNFMYMIFIYDDFWGCYAPLGDLRL